jgi:hypothetical protein
VAFVGLSVLPSSGRGFLSMKEFYIKHMIESHNARKFDDRRNYAQAAGIDFVKYFYLTEETL